MRVPEQSVVRLTRFAGAAICALAGAAGIATASQANELLVDAYRIQAAVLIGLFSAALLVAAALLALSRRGGLLIGFVGALAMLLVVVLGLQQMGGVSLHQALLQASCAPGFGICFNQVAVLVQLCVLVALGCIATSAVKRLVFRHGV